MSDYKKYFIRQMGLKESQIKSSDIDKDEYPGIDPDELIAGANDEAGEHNMPKDKAIQTAVQHLDEPGQAHYYSGLEKAKDKGMLKDALCGGAISPTAIATPVIGLSVKGSSTGGLPSGIDQTNTNITPSNLGGYEEIPTNAVNSKLVNKTPVNPQINSSQPIADVPNTKDTVTHPHQIQRDANQPPQEVTGASTDSDDTLTLKSALPKGLDIDIPEEQEEQEEQANLNESKHKSGCQCGFCKNKGKFSKKDNPDDEKKEDKKENDIDEVFERHKKLAFETIEKRNLDEENVGSSKPFTTNWKMDSEKGGVVKVDESNPEGLVRLSEAFERMRGLANLGERRVLSNGLWGTCNKIKEDVDNDDDEPSSSDFELADVQVGYAELAEVVANDVKLLKLMGKEGLTEEDLNNHTFKFFQFVLKYKDLIAKRGNFNSVSNDEDLEVDWSYERKDSPGSSSENPFPVDEKKEKVRDSSDVCKKCGKEFDYWWFLRSNPNAKQPKYPNLCPDCQGEVAGYEHDFSNDPRGQNEPIDEKNEKWMQDASNPKTKGALHKDLGIPEDKKIPTERLESIKKTLSAKSDKGTLSDKELTLFRRVNAALNMRKSQK